MRAAGRVSRALRRAARTGHPGRTGGRSTATRCSTSWSAAAREQQRRPAPRRGARAGGRGAGARGARGAVSRGHRRLRRDAQPRRATLTAPPPAASAPLDAHADTSCSPRPASRSISGARFARADEAARASLLGSRARRATWCCLTLARRHRADLLRAALARRADRGARPRDPERGASRSSSRARAPTPASPRSSTCTRRRARCPTRWCSGATPSATARWSSASSRSSPAAWT